MCGIAGTIFNKKFPLGTEVSLLKLKKIIENENASTEKILELAWKYKSNINFLRFCKDVSEKEELSNKIIMSEISNLALKHNIIDIGGELIETDVGDRFVVNAVKENNAVLGCEPSGHFHFPKYSNSMDGFLAMQNFLLLITHHKGDLDKELFSLKHYERIQENISIEKYPNLELKKIRDRIKPMLKENYEKLIIRQSMWDPVIRIYYDYKDKNNFPFLKENLINILSGSIK